jgi:23S rRNA pseudouridine2605 synthase
LLERLQRTLARAGVASRRKAEDLIRAGRVRVSGRIVTELGVRVDPAVDRVELDGRALVPERLVYLVLHKPRGVVSTARDPEGRPTVLGCLEGIGVRVVPVGRLDFHTSGVLLLTNDGDFAEVLSHPRTQVPKVYVAKVAGELGDRDLERWRQSIVIDGRATRPADVKRLRTAGGKTWLEITLHEGRNRQIRRLGDTAGFAVMRLSRVAFAGLTVQGLRPGQYRHLTSEERGGLQRSYGVPRRVHTPRVQAASRKKGRVPGDSDRGKRQHRRG